MYKGAWRSVIVAVLLLGIGLITGLVVAAMIQSYQSPNALEGWQSLLGSLLGALVTLFAGYLAWSAVRVQVDAESQVMQSQLSMIAIQAASDSREALLGRVKLLNERLESVRRSYLEDVRGIIEKANIALRNGNATAEEFNVLEKPLYNFADKAGAFIWTDKVQSESLRARLDAITFEVAKAHSDLMLHLRGSLKKLNPRKLTDDQIEEQFKALSDQFSKGVSDLHVWFNDHEKATSAEFAALEKRLTELDEYILKKGVFSV